MKFKNVEFQNLIFSRTKREKNIFLSSTSFRLKKQTSKNVADTTFKKSCLDEIATPDLVTFTEETLNEKLHFLCSVTAKGF